MQNALSKAILRTSGTKAFFTSEPVHVRYLTGIELSSGSVLVHAGTITLFTDARYLEMAQKKAKGRFKVQSQGELLGRMSKVRECGMESDRVTVEQFGRMKRKFKNTKFVQTSGVIEEIRRAKTPQECTAFRKSQKITREILRRVPSLLKRSITERELAWQLKVWAHELGAEDMAFDPIVAFGTNTSRPHHHPTTKKLLKGHIVQIDVGVKYGGYCSDQSAVFFTGKPTAQQKHVYNTLLEAKDAAIARVRPGVTNHELDKVARKILAREGIEEYFVHALGHGVGLEIHEGITLSGKAARVPLRKNEIITIEPGVYFPGKFGMRVEEEIIVE